MAMKCCTKLETAKERCPIVFQGHPSNFKVTRYKTSPILTQIGRFWTIGRSQLSNPSDLPCFISIQISLKYVRNGPIINRQLLVQIMAWCRPGDKQLSEPMVVSYWRKCASLGLNELTINFNTLRPEQVATILQKIFSIHCLNGNLDIMISISRWFVYIWTIDKKLELFFVMAWCHQAISCCKKQYKCLY